MNSQLLEKYNVAAPRYTSYPTVPFWQNIPDELSWQDSVKRAFKDNPIMSLYVHLPFCERLCTYCGCNKRITKNHKVEEPYIASLLKEWRMYESVFNQKPVINQLHFGGGTPTFFAPSKLRYFIEELHKSAFFLEQADISFEAHPNSTTKEHLTTLQSIGFNRISIGVQDFHQDILKVINRFQTDEQITYITQEARAQGYQSINYDLIFGLPFQTPDHIKRNMARIADLMPDRIAFYSYAHVPWVSPSQRAYDEKDLPTGTQKRYLYELGRELLESLGYVEIGLDHFALPTDELYQAMQTGRLHRNFMGYTTLSSDLSIGLGASAISDTPNAYIQNIKGVEAYQKMVDAGKLPIYRGHTQTEEDQYIRQHIKNIMCQFETSWNMNDPFFYVIKEGLERLQEMHKDELIKLGANTLTVTDQGRPFLRNIAMAIDAGYWRKQASKNTFSKVV